MMHARAFARAADAAMDDGDMHSISQMENPALQDTDSKDSQLLKDEVSKVTKKNMVVFYEVIKIYE